MPDENGGFYRKILDNVYDGVYFIDAEKTITYWNKGAERISGYSASEVVGLKCTDNILEYVDEDGESLHGDESCLALEAMKEGVIREAEVFLHHRDGHRVPVLTHISPIRDSSGAVMGAVQVFTDISSEIATRHRIEFLERLALIDELTRLGNRRYCEILIRARLDELERYDWSFGLLFFDIDHFKNVNDEYGHAVGDLVLKMIARTSERSVRSFDTICRWGGEEFIAIIVNVDEEQLLAVGEKLRLLIERSSARHEGGQIRVTVSVGASAGRLDDTPRSLVERADDLMYRSKESGRNRVTLG